MQWRLGRCGSADAALSALAAGVSADLYLAATRRHSTGRQPAGQPASPVLPDHVGPKGCDAAPGASAGTAAARAAAAGGLQHKRHHHPGVRVALAAWPDGSPTGQCGA